MGLICTCQGCGVKLDAVRKCVLASAAIFAFLHGALLAGRVLGSSSETDAAVRNTMRPVTGANYTDPDAVAEDDDPADAAMRIIVNGLALIGNLCGLIGTKSYISNGEARMFKVYMSYLLANCLFCAGYTLRAIMDIERYCEETQDHDADCEDDSAQTGVSILFIYQATQMLSMWAAWSLYVGIRDPSSVSPVMSYPVQQPMQPEQAYAMPVAAPVPSTASHGHDMAAVAGKHKHRHGDGHGNGKRRKESGKRRAGDKRQSGGDEYEPSSWDTPKSGKGGKSSKGGHEGGGSTGKPSKPRKVIPIYEA